MGLIRCGKEDDKRKNKHIANNFLLIVTAKLV